MGDQSLPDRVAAALYQGKHTRRHTAAQDRGMDRLGHDFGRAGMGGMTAQYHRATGGKG